jgi:hypothetical protein
MMMNWKGFVRKLSFPGIFVVRLRKTTARLSCISAQNSNLAPPEYSSKSVTSTVAVIMNKMILTMVVVVVTLMTSQWFVFWLRISLLTELIPVAAVTSWR